MPFLAVYSDKYTNTAVNITHNNTISQLVMSNSPIKTGNTREAKNTVEKFEQIEDKALSCDLLSFNRIIISSSLLR